MNIRDELREVGFAPAGTIRPVDAGGCEYSLDPDVTGFVVYAHIVGNQIKKFGTTTPSLRSRVSQNASTINQVIALAEGRARRVARWHERPFDAFKCLAPQVIKAGQTIDVWAVQSTSAEYGALERHLNARYNTIVHGWAVRLG